MKRRIRNIKKKSGLKMKFSLFALYVMFFAIGESTGTVFQTTMKTPETERNAPVEKRDKLPNIAPLGKYRPSTPKIIEEKSDTNSNVLAETKETTILDEIIPTTNFVPKSTRMTFYTTKTTPHMETNGPVETGDKSPITSSTNIGSSTAEIFKNDTNSSYLAETTETTVSETSSTTKSITGYEILFSVAQSGIYQMSLDRSEDPIKRIDSREKNIYFHFDPVSQMMFCLEGPWHLTTLVKSHFNGTGRQIIQYFQTFISGIAVDWLEQKLFVGDNERQIIRIYNMNSSNQESQISLAGDNGRLVKDISIDIFHSVVYWSSYMLWRDSGYIYRSNYIGNNKQTHNSLLLTGHHFRAMIIVVDYPRQDIYYAGDYPPGIYKMKTDGSNRRLVVENVRSLGAIAIQVNYDDLRCPEIDRCFGIYNIWTCLKKAMICDGIPQCYGELDEVYCCHGNTHNCSSIQEINVSCRSAEGDSYHNSLELDCSLQMKYLDDNSFPREETIHDLQKYHIMRQFTGQTVFTNSDKLIVSGQIPCVFREAFKQFHKLRELVLHNTNLQYLGKYLPNQPRNESDKTDLENFITSIWFENVFEGHGNMRHLTISENQFLSTIHNNAFNGLENLQILEIRENRNLATINVDAFDRLKKLQTLFISDNSARWKTNEYVFRDFTSLKNLTLSRTVLNKLTFSGEIPSLKNGDFHTDTINEIMLLKTCITHITEYFFSGIAKLEKITISENLFLSNITENAFSRQKYLLQLTISNNPLLQHIVNGAFNGLESLKNLTISHQYSVSNLEDGLFHPLTSLEVIDLRKNNLLFTKISLKTNTKITEIYSDAYFTCCTTPYPITDARCHAPKDDISSCDDLIADRRLISILWLIAIIAFFGNTSVLLYRFIKDRKSLKQTFSVFVINLGCSDLIMGLYMFIIGIHDSIFEGGYAWHDSNWKASNICKMSGTMASTSSESSVMFIGLITIDRFLAVKYPIGGKRFSLRQACILSVVAWIISVLMGIVPVLTFPEFYSYSGTCLALPLTGNFKPGWQISVGIFLGFNFVMFVLIVIGQICIMREIIQSARRAGSKHSDKEREAATFLFLVAISDALCWFPVGIMVILALAGVKISGQIYAWVIIFVLPVNSAVNPFLYTFAPLCRKKQKEVRLAKKREAVADPPARVQTKL